MREHYEPRSIARVAIVVAALVTSAATAFAQHQPVHPVDPVDNNVPGETVVLTGSAAASLLGALAQAPDVRANPALRAWLDRASERRGDTTLVLTIPHDLPRAGSSDTLAEYVSLPASTTSSPEEAILSRPRPATPEEIALLEQGLREQRAYERGATRGTTPDAPN
jgi:hypothetical protein